MALILIVDDDDDVREFERLTLKMKYSVIEATDGQHGFELFEEHKPALVITDMCMPRLDGLELARRIKEHPTQGRTPVIMVTGATAGEELPPGFWKMGTVADGFIEKPLHPATLLAEVQKQLEAFVKLRPAPKGKGFY